MARKCEKKLEGVQRKAAPCEDAQRAWRGGPWQGWREDMQGIADVGEDVPAGAALLT